MPLPFKRQRRQPDKAAPLFGEIYDDVPEKLSDSDKKMRMRGWQARIVFQRQNRFRPENVVCADGMCAHCHVVRREYSGDNHHMTVMLVQNVVTIS